MGNYRLKITPALFFCFNNIPKGLFPYDILKKKMND